MSHQANPSGSRPYTRYPASSRRPRGLLLLGSEGAPPRGGRSPLAGCPVGTFPPRLLNGSGFGVSRGLFWSVIEFTFHLRPTLADRPRGRPCPSRQVRVDQSIFTCD